MNRQIATFRINQAILGLDILAIKEIYKYSSLTPIPGTSDKLNGLLNLRGKIITILDLGKCLKINEEEKEETKKLIILKTDSEISRFVENGKLPDIKLGEDIVGLLIDKMEDVLNIQDEDILQTPPNLDTVDKQLIEGVLKLENKLVLLINISAILDEIIQNEANIGSANN